MTQLWRNAGFWGLLRLVIATAGAVGFGLVMPFLREGYWPAAVGFTLGIVTPWIFRQALVDHVAWVHRVHRYAGYAIVGTCLLLREPLKQAGPAVVTFAVAGLAAYLSVSYSSLSDREVTRTSRT